MGDESMFYPNCGKELNEQWRVCPNCGTEISDPDGEDDEDDDEDFREWK